MHTFPSVCYSWRFLSSNNKKCIPALAPCTGCIIIKIFLDVAGNLCSNICVIEYKFDICLKAFSFCKVFHFRKQERCDFLAFYSLFFCFSDGLIYYGIYFIRRILSASGIGHVTNIPPFNPSFSFIEISAPISSGVSSLQLAFSPLFLL